MGTSGMGVHGFVFVCFCFFLLAFFLVIVNYSLLGSVFLFLLILFGLLVRGLFLTVRISVEDFVDRACFEVCVDSKGVLPLVLLWLCSLSVVVLLALRGSIKAVTQDRKQSNKTSKQFITKKYFKIDDFIKH